MWSEVLARGLKDQTPGPVSNAMVAAKNTCWLKPRSTKWTRDSNITTIRGQVIRNGVRLPGLINSLLMALWPEFEPSAAPRLANFGHAPKVGVDIEDQIEDWFSTSKYEDGRYVKLGKDPGRKEARIFCGIMVALGLTRVDSQAPVAHGRVGTRIDWMVRGPKGRQILIELKTGHNYGLSLAQGKIVGFPDFNNNRLEHAQFQLLWTWAAIQARGIECEPWLVMINKTAKDKFGTKDTVLQIAKKIRSGVGGKLVRPLPKRHRAEAKKLLDTVK